MHRKIVEVGTVPSQLNKQKTGKGFWDFVQIITYPCLAHISDIAPVAQLYKVL